MKTTLNKIIDRIADVFSVFDFSFIISGITSFIMIYTFLSFRNSDILLFLDGNLSWIFVIFTIYILGLIMFALGRYVRQVLLGQKKYKYKLFEKYNVCDAKNEEKIDALYCKYWDNLKKEGNEKDYDYYSRLWVMTAVYEGLIGNVVLALVLFITYNITVFNNLCICFCNKDLWKVLLMSFLICLVGLILSIEARKYADTIVKDLIAKNT